MINPSLKLNPKIFDKNIEQVAIRTGFGHGLLSAAEDNKSVVGLSCDLTESTQMHFFRDKFPERFFEMGIAEQNMASVASGMAAAGKIPVITSYAMFSPGRNWEQIRTTICYNNRPVVIAGSHAGVSVGPDGGTHQAIEDIALTRVIPNLVVLSPCDAIEAAKATIKSIELGKPVYLRLARVKSPIITTDETPFEIGKAELFFGPKHGEKADVAIIATGSLVYNAVQAANDFSKENGSEKLSVKVLNMPSIKPLDTESIESLAKDCGVIVTVEEHQIAGGLGSAVAEHLASVNPTLIEFVGIHDQFGQSGTPDELLTHFGLDKYGIKAAVLRAHSRKQY